MATNSAAISAGTGLVSGINYTALISQLTAVDQQPITQMQTQQQDYQLQIAALSTFSTDLSTFKSALDTLNSAGQFNTINATVSNTSSGSTPLSVSASSSAAVGTHSISVNQLAEANIKASQGWADENTTAISPSGGTFSFKVGSGGALTNISVSSTMTLQGLADAINSSGSAVTASITNDGSGVDPYRLQLTTNTTGYGNEIYITNNSTNLDYTDKLIGQAYAYSSNSYTGAVASNAGTNNYTGTVNNQTYLMQIVSPGASGTATYKYSIDGGVTWLGAGGQPYVSSAGDNTAGGAITTNTSLQYVDGALSSNTFNEGVEASFSATGTLAAGDEFSIAAYNPELQTAQNAVINVDGQTITNSSNTITDAVQGVTMNLLQAVPSSPVTLSISSDTSAAQTNIQGFVTAYNTLMQYINQQETYDPSQNTAGADINSTNPLLTDPALMIIKNSIVNTVTGTIPGINPSQYSGLSQIGISTDATTGNLTLDTSTLASALQTNPSAVANLFISSATPSNAAVSYLSETSATQPGNYSVYITTAPQKASVAGDENLSSNGLTNAETLTFEYSNNKTSSTPAYTDFNVTLPATSTINTIVNTLNSAFATNNVGLTASNVNGKLSITSADYGADNWFQVSSNQAGGAGGNGGHQIFDTWDTGSTSSVTRSKAGVDIVGTINGHSAQGTGDVLTSSSGFPESGLSISVDSSQTGGFGTVAVSSGIASSLSSSIAAWTDQNTGIIVNESNSKQTTINNLTTQETTIQNRISQETQSLQTQFAALESLLGTYKTESSTVTSMFANLSDGWTQNSAGAL